MGSSIPVGWGAISSKLGIISRVRIHENMPIWSRWALKYEQSNGLKRVTL